MKKRLQILIGARLGLALLLLSTVAVFNLVTSRQAFWSLAVMAAFVSLLTVVYVVILKKNSAYERQALIQLLIDTFVITVFVYLTGDIVSPLSALYLIAILVASTMLRRKAVYATATASALMYGAVCALVVDHVVPPGQLLLQHSNLSVAMTVSTVTLHMIGFFVVAALSCQLSERLQKSTAALETTSRELANLTAYNDRIIESISSGLITTELDGTIVTFNPAAQEITGYSQRAVQGRSLSAFLPRIAGEVRRLTSRPDSFKKFERLNADEKNAEGRTRHLGFSVAPLSSESGSRLGFVIALQDLTEIDQLEEQMRRNERLAVLGRMAAAIAHEIRNPLASMRGSIQVLQSELALNEEQETLMDIVLRESDRLNKIITDFLEYARPPRANPGLIDMKEILSETLRLIVRGGEAAATHRISESYPEGPVLYVADPNQMRQVCWNIARNAILAMPSGGELTVSLETYADGGIKIRFRDTGIGMSEIQREHLFEPFATSRPRGTGLGMAIVHQIVADHKGEIGVASEPGKGTTVEIKLPPALSSTATLAASRTIQMEGTA